MTHTFDNPFRPGAGHLPPYLAGRNAEQTEIKKMLGQKIITSNVVLTGLRGVGKTVLLETFKQVAYELKWLWVGNDLSESASVTEANMATRILADIALITSSLVIREKKLASIGFKKEEKSLKQTLNYDTLRVYFDSVPGLISDKLKSTLELIWETIPRGKVAGIVFAYDEAQNLADHAARNEYPLSLLLEVFQSLQKKNIPFMLVLTGLPTLFPKLVESRTYAERMFHVMFLQQLNAHDSRDAIVKPIAEARCPIKFTAKTVERIADLSGGYPYFIQFICKEMYDIWLAKIKLGESPFIPENEIMQKLDVDFFQGRWAKATDRQRELLMIIPSLPNCDDEFTVQEIVVSSKQKGRKAFSASHVNQMLASLADAGLVYKNRHGRYSLAVPLMAGFIARQITEQNTRLKILS